MRLALLCLAATLAGGPLALADTLTYPVGTYYLDGQSFLSGVHMSDNATVHGTVTFNSSSVLTGAYILVHFVDTGDTYLFNHPGPTDFIPQYHIQTSTVFGALSPDDTIDVDLAEFANSNGVFSDLTCGTDCHPDAYIPSINEGIEYYGTLTPAPEPSTLALLGTGALGALGALRRRLWPS